jgi:hypothetical protein
VSITYPLALPTVTGLRSVRLMARTVVAVSESPFTLQQQVQRHAGQHWAAAIALPPMTRAAAEEWWAFLIKLNGMEGTFLLGDPAGVTPRGIATGTPLVKGAAQTGNSLITDGWTAGQTGILKAGDYLQLGSGSSARLYKNLNDVNSDGTGDATLDIWPRLRSVPADDAPIVVNDCQGVFRLETNEIMADIELALIYGLNFAAREAF